MQLKSPSKNRFRKEQVTAFALLLNTLSWYFIGYLMIEKIGSAFDEASVESLCLRLIYPFFIITSAIACSVFLGKVRRVRFFYLWLLFGIALALCAALPLGSSFWLMLVLVGVLGVSLGVGTPLCFGYFAESVSIENRGKVGGFILFGTVLSAPVAFLVMSPLDLASSALFLALWRAWSLPFLLLDSDKRQYELSSEKLPSLASVLRDRTFYLYFTAWLMFALVDSFEGRIVDVAIGDFRFFIRVIEPTIAAFSAIIGGLLSDWVGRKRVLVFGFVSLGIAYATIGLFSQVWFSWFFYFVIDGVALGLLWTLFVIVLWGDMSEKGSAKFYAIGEAPFFLTRILSELLAPYMILIPESSSFSLAAFFLFLAVLPLLIVPETLPEKKMKDRELKTYLDKAKKIKEKYT